ncbi:hypothetical protein PMAYCL1PPCAC_21984, partial [Pristionchus mayeri]
MTNLTLDVFWLSVMPIYLHVILIQCMIHVALMLTYTLHYKYTTIVRMTEHRKVTRKKSFQSMTITVAGCAYFVGHSLRMLSITLTMPLVIQVTPLFIVVLSMVMQWFSPGSMNFALCVYLCHASFHSILLIFTTPSYR